MRFAVSDTCLAHDPGDRHPESPDRIRAIKRGLAKRHGVDYREGPPADRADAERVHDGDYLDEIQSFCADGGGQWDPDTVAVTETWDAALAAAGLAVWAANHALDGHQDRQTPFSIGRPPGHHATADEAMGFCFLNNAAVAAGAALEREDVDHVAILDWDVHHGNGTQDIFYDRDDVSYFSVHEEGLYPGTGDFDETGAGDGEGYTVNVPLAAGGGDPDYEAVFEDVFAPAMAAFDPDLLLVSAGFDAHRHDPISRMHVSTDGFGMLTDRVRSMADDVDAAVGFVLEGGYGLDTLSDGIGMVHEIFDGLTPIEPDGDPTDATRDAIDTARDAHPDVWS
ncbi:histone deacetylase family protein [Halocalculus aciditolerans]|uniref:Histone deacetylase n=1 Tax=Halocalculus aciditolerans TaxID=1383812 RepID=A0A830FAD6_9EURY|nr:histone deacetylase [Halocalculus aciditolerans]GGL70163.1 histone deacetylase [Halocalculus aciditolerans]